MVLDIPCPKIVTNRPLPTPPSDAILPVSAPPVLPILEKGRVRALSTSNQQAQAVPQAGFPRQNAYRRWPEDDRAQTPPRPQHQRKALTRAIVLPPLAATQRAALSALQLRHVPIHPILDNLSPQERATSQMRGGSMGDGCGHFPNSPVRSSTPIGRGTA